MKLVEGEVITCLTLCRYSHQCVSIFAMNRPNWCKLMQAGDQASREVNKYCLLTRPSIESQPEPDFVTLVHTKLSKWFAVPLTIDGCARDSMVSVERFLRDPDLSFLHICSQG